MHTLHHAQQGNARKNLLAGLFIISGLVLLAWAAFPPSFSTDLERIGQGKPAIALIYDLENEASTNLMEGFNAIRAEYEQAVEFLLVDTASPKGKTFLATNPAATGSALYFSSNGQQIAVMHGPQETSILAQSIDRAFGL